MPDRQVIPTQLAESSSGRPRHTVTFGGERRAAEDKENKTKEMKVKLGQTERGEKKILGPVGSQNSVPIIKVAKVTSIGSAACPPPSPAGVTLKVYAKCLNPDIEYKTVIVSRGMTGRELIWLLLSKYRMKHRDPKVLSQPFADPSIVELEYFYNYKFNLKYFKYNNA